MMSDGHVDLDPFADPIVEDQRRFVDESTLNVGRNASLTLGTDALIVLDEGFQEQDRFNCCGTLPRRSKTTRAIPFYNILWANNTKVDITVHYAKRVSKSEVRVAFIHYPLSPDQIDISAVTTFTTRLLDRAYGSAQKNKRIKVLINPYGGSGKAFKWYNRDIEPIFAAAHCEIDVERTQYMGHAVEIAQNLDISAYDVVASCSGDGLPHEVFNGLARKPNATEALRKLAVVQLPCGTGNAMSCNLNGTASCSLAALAIIKGFRTPLDLVSVTQGNRRTISFLSQAIGIVAESDLGTDNMRWMGDARFTYGFLVRLLGKTVWPCDIALNVEIEDKTAIKEHYFKECQRRLENSQVAARRVTINPPSLESADLDSSEGDGLPKLRFGTVQDPLPASWELVPYERLGNFYCGNMAYMARDAEFFPASLPHDGLLDLVTIDGDISRTTSIQTLLSIEKGTFFDLPHVNVRKISGFRLVPRESDGYISIDGERVPFEPFQCEVHRGLGTTISKNGYLYEGKGVA